MVSTFWSSPFMHLVHSFVSLSETHSRALVNSFTHFCLVHSRTPKPSHLRTFGQHIHTLLIRFICKPSLCSFPNWVIRAQVQVWNFFSWLTWFSENPSRTSKMNLVTLMRWCTCTKCKVHLKRPCSHPSPCMFPMWESDILYSAKWFSKFPMWDYS